MVIAFLTESLRRVLSLGTQVGTAIAILGLGHSCAVRSYTNDISDTGSSEGVSFISAAF